MSPLPPPPPSGNTNPKLEQAATTDESIQQVHSILIREKPEPSEGYRPMPLFLLGFISAMIFICSVYLVHYRGDFDPLVYDERYDPKLASANAGPVQLTPEQIIAQGKKAYQTCSTCHQANGQGLKGTYPPLAGSEWVQGSEERVIRILLHGLTGELKVHGDTFNGNMPAFGPGGGYNWKDDRIAQVLTYIRQEWGNTAPPITTDKVKEIRTTAAADRKTPWTQPELEKVQ
ncbi:c-type cytochrome [Geminisphaera colitermitum]|uniref:c-type cytochrome n=1 Tax=Geminisphaera colitermitum TaxID=1148786 RepID=UPI00019653E4|nr:cytochrome c [Geminisphaera colitermitum]